ncbi:PadR family transcriptional regulator [uncultured Clostridium sp.]|uniref:PadR family transcriptional regulator n=1 Tax=uncultured Clostridium sp. TaxID=59620 RepID=UPI00260A95AE|nr:PadR family transcriptional regulator [uncultured Clostridium sp.]
MKYDDFLKESIKTNMFNKDTIFNNILDKIEEEKLNEQLSILILLLVSRKDTYGFSIINELDLLIKKKLKNKEGTIYPILHTLEDKKLITSYWVDDEIRKKYYRISKLGKSHLKDKKSIVDYLKKPNPLIYTEEFSWI